ncbi:MAG: hypothetical protein HC806_03025 [Anaerolineae bacterium]|nr:hypothetical protein [Anaerolineae bacterium]
MKPFRIFILSLLVLSMILSACSPPGTAEPTTATEPTDAPAPTDVPAATEEVMEPKGVVCEEPVKVGLITDGTGALAIYGAHILRSFMLGMEYATGAPGSAGDTFTLDLGTNTFTLD